MTTKNKHGGSRPGAGRRPNEQKTFAKQVYLYKHQLALTSKEIRERIDGNVHTPNSYLLAWDEQRLQDVCAVATKYENKKPSSWAIRRGGSCMRKSDGFFIREPIPSSRDEDFFSECRYASFEDAARSYFTFHQ